MARDIWANALRAPPTVQDFDAQNQAFQQNALTLQTAQQALTDQNSLRQATMQFGTDPSANRALLAGTGNYKAVQDYTKSMFDNAHTQAQTDVQRSQVPLNASKQGEQDALATNHALDSKIKATDFHLQQLQGITDLSQIPGWVADGVTSGVQDFSASKEGLSKFLADAQQNGLDAAKSKAMKGGQSVAESLKQQQALLIANQQSATSVANNTATNQAHLQATGMTNATSRANNSATIAKDYKVAGIDPQTGNFVGAGDGASGGMSGMVDALGNYKMDPSQAFSRMAPAMRAGVISAVQAKYPDYDPTTYSAKKAAATSFTSGANGTALRKFATASDHLAQLDELGDALNNGNIQAVNKIANAFGVAIGKDPAVTYNAVKHIIGQEVVGAIVAGGGTGSERDDAAKAFSTDNSPSQQKSVNGAYRNVMGAQHENLLSQRRAAGLPDSTLPNYKPPSAVSGQSALPSSNAQGWTLHQDAKGNKAYVSPDGKQFQQVGQ